MLLSMFSHQSGLHLFVNMYVLWSFGGVASVMFGREQFIAAYLSAGNQLRFNYDHESILLYLT